MLDSKPLSQCCPCCGESLRLVPLHYDWKYPDICPKCGTELENNKVSYSDHTISEEITSRIPMKGIESRLGISYEEFEKLDFETQQKLLLEYRKKQKEDDVIVMVGYGELATSVNAKKGEDVMVRYGNIIEAGLTLEEEKERLESDLDDILYSKPVAFVKKLERKIKNR